MQMFQGSIPKFGGSSTYSQFDALDIYEYV